MAKKKARDPDAPAPQVSTHYGGEIVISFDPAAKRNRYAITDCGVVLKPTPPSVTTITDLRDKSAPLMHWAVNCCLEICRENIHPDEIHGAQFLEDVWAKAKAEYRNVKKKAADTGTLAHNALWRYFTLPPHHFAPPLADTPVRARFDEAVKWFDSHEIKTVCAETRVYSRKHGYTGTLDNLSYVDGVLSLVDYKAAKSVYSTYIFQTAAYIMAREEETGEKIPQIYILQIGEDKTIPYRYNREQIEVAFEGFLGLLQMYKADKKLGKIAPEEQDWLIE